MSYDWDGDGDISSNTHLQVIHCLLQFSHQKSRITFISNTDLLKKRVSPTHSLYFRLLATLELMIYETERPLSSEKKYLSLNLSRLLEVRRRVTFRPSSRIQNTHSRGPGWNVAKVEALDYVSCAQ